MSKATKTTAKPKRTKAPKPHDQRLPGEPDAAYAAYLLWRSLPPHRRAIDQVPGKLAVLCRWRSIWQWFDRALVWDSLYPPPPPPELWNAAAEAYAMAAEGIVAREVRMRHLEQDDEAGQRYAGIHLAARLRALEAAGVAGDTRMDYLAVEPGAED